MSLEYTLKKKLKWSIYEIWRKSNLKSGTDLNNFHCILILNLTNLPYKKFKIKNMGNWGSAKFEKSSMKVLKTNKQKK